MLSKRGLRLWVGVVALALVALVATTACTREVIKEVEVEKPVIVEKVVIKEVPVEKIVTVEKEVIKEVPVREVVVVEKEVIKTVEVIKEVEGMAKPRKDFVNLAASSAVQKISPFTAVSGYTSLIYRYTHSALIQPYETGGKYVPDLAERWEAAEDGSSYTFYIRPNAVWHDGAPLTAADVGVVIHDPVGPQEQEQSSLTIVGDQGWERLLGRQDQQGCRDYRDRRLHDQV